MSTILIKNVINILLILKLVIGEIEFKCPIEAGNEAFADPETCRRFYQCASGVAFKSNCPSGLYFDDVSKLCTYREEARCGPISTTASPTSQTPVEDIAKRCSRKNCKLPDCFCSRSGTRIPGDLNSSEVPQMILLTFDGAVNLNNYDSYMKIFSKKFQNPNGCEIRGTFFVSHEYSNYQMIEQIALDDHEIAVGTISGSKGLENESYDHWVDELVGMKTILNTFANVSKDNIIGVRAPYLKPGRNIEFEVLFNKQFIYDSSIGAPASEIPFWPYTLDYKIPHKCKSVSCPTKSFPGVWEVPFNMHHVPDDEGGRCPYLDQCVLHNHDANDILEWLQLDFSRHYEKNKAPYMMAFHTNWFALKNLRDGLTKFLEWATQKNDIWFVTYRQMLEWITAPVPLKSIEKSSLWDCKNRKNKSTCETSNKCPLKHTLTKGNYSEIRYLETCRSCPDVYPWLGNPKGILFGVTNQTNSNRDRDYDEDDNDDDDDDDDENNENREKF